MYIVRERDALQHHGIKGMKWGVRRFQDKSGGLTAAGKKRYNSSDFDKKKADYKAAKKAYNKAYRKYDTRRTAAFSPFESARKKNDERFNKAMEAGKRFNKAAAEYKKAKRDRRQAINRTERDFNDAASRLEKKLYSSGTRRQAAKYVVDKGMTMDEARKKAQGDAWRNTALFVAAAGAAMYITNR